MELQERNSGNRGSGSSDAQETPPHGKLGVLGLTQGDQLPARGREGANSEAPGAVVLRYRLFHSWYLWDHPPHMTGMNPGGQVRRSLA